MASQIVITGRGVISALGMGVSKHIEAFQKEESGLKQLTLFQSNHKVPVGEVILSNDELKHYLDISKEEIVSRTALLGLCAVKEALEESQLNGIEQGRIGLISATSVGGMDLSEQFYQDFRIDSTKGNLQYIAPHSCEWSTNFIAQKANISGFKTTISTACSSSANAIMLGARLLKAHILDAVVVGGTDALCKFTLNGFSSLKILDSKPCKPFDKSRTGLNLGEGAGYIVLQRKEDISNYVCELTAWANANDATHQTATSENGEGAYLSMKNALDSANIVPNEVSYINAHGTGTPNNDASEYQAFTRLFSIIPPYSSTKGYTGHTLAAAGGIEAVFASIALQKQMVFKNINFEVGSSTLTTLPIAKTEKKSINVVLSNSFGFGGNCSTLIFKK